MKRNAHPREVIGNRKSKCEREGKCVPEGTPRWSWNSSNRCKTCKRLMPISKVV